jgi:murein L,D-transpeptidase YafK
VEKATQTLHVVDCTRGEPRLERMLSCTTGRNAGDKRAEGDLRTPEGVYLFTRYIPGSALPPLYGAGALVMDYPNHLDVLDRKTGGGIWLHGVETDDRVHVRQDTRGCVAVRNDHFEWLRGRILLNETPVLVTERLRLEAASEVRQRSRDLQRLVEEWRRAWESEDLERYLAHYDASFWSDGKDREGWARHKRTLAERYRAIAVGIDEPFILREKDRLWVSFRQEYVSDGHRDVGLKTLTLRAAPPEAPGPPWSIVGEAWRPLESRFEILDPGAVVARLTLEDVARLAPDAAPPDVAAPVAATSAGAGQLLAAGPPAPPIAAPWDTTVRHGTPSDAAPPEADQGPRAMVPVAREPLPEARLAAVVLPDAPTTALEVTVTSEEPPVATEPVATAQPAGPASAGALLGPDGSGADESLATIGAAPATQPGRWRVAAVRLADPTSAARSLRLWAPHAQHEGGELRVSVQLLNDQPGLERRVRVRWDVDGRMDDGGGAVSLRQGVLLERTTAVPPGATLVTLTLTVTEDGGRSPLVQAVIVTLGTET